MLYKYGGVSRIYYIYPSTNEIAVVEVSRSHLILYRSPRKVDFLNFNIKSSFSVNVCVILFVCFSYISKISPLIIKKVDGQTLLITLSDSGDLKLYPFVNESTVELVATQHMGLILTCFPVERDSKSYVFFETLLYWSMCQITTSAVHEVARGSEERVASSGCAILSESVTANYVMLQQSGVVSFKRLYSPEQVPIFYNIANGAGNYSNNYQSVWPNEPKTFWMRDAILDKMDSCM